MLVWFSPKNVQIQIGSESKNEQISQSLLKSHWNPRKILLDLSRPLKQLATPELRFCFRWFGNTSTHKMFIEIYTRFAWWDVSVYLTLTHTHSLRLLFVRLVAWVSESIYNFNSKDDHDESSFPLSVKNLCVQCSISTFYDSFQMFGCIRKDSIDSSRCSLCEFCCKTKVRWIQWEKFHLRTKLTTRFFTSLKIISFVFSLVVLVSIRNCIPRTKCFVLVCFKTATTQQQKKWSNKTQKQLSFGCQLNTNWSVRNETKQHQHQPQPYASGFKCMCLVFVCGRNREKRRKKTHSRRPQMLLPHSRSLSPFLIRSFVRFSQHYIQRCLNTVCVYDTFLWIIHQRASVYWIKQTHTDTDTKQHPRECFSVYRNVRTSARKTETTVWRDQSRSGTKFERSEKIHSHTPTPTDSW